MKDKTEKLVAELQNTAEQIDTLSFSDTQSWRKVSADLENKLKKHPALIGSADFLVPLCVQGIVAIAEQETTQTLTMIGAVTEGLDAIGSALQKNPEAEDRIRRAGDDLKEALADAAIEPDDASGSTPDSIYPSVQTIDDAAALIIQLEPDEPDGWNHLQTVLRQMIAKGLYNPGCNKYLEQALDHLDGYADIAPEDFEDWFTRIEQIIEDAAGASETDGRKIGSTETETLADIPPAAQQNPDGSKSAAMDRQDSDDPERDYMPEDADADLLGEFIAESNDLIALAEEALLSLEVDPEDVDAVAKVFRAFHTVKGTSAFMELDLISELGHHAETLLSRVRDQEIRYAGGYADLSLRALDMIKELVSSVQEALSGAPLLKPAEYDNLMAILVDPEASGVSENNDDVKTPRVGDMLVAQGKVEKQQVEAAVSQHPEEQVGVAVVKTKTAKVIDVGQALRAQKRIKGGHKVVNTTVRVSTRRLDRLIDMVGELVIAHSMVAQDTLLVDSSNHELQKKVSHTNKIVRELQDISMSMRMVPLKATFNKMARLVRDVSRKVGKSVNFVTEGEDTEIDRNLVDVINDPLVHMVRNAVDHGIELPDDRELLGKPCQGLVQLSAYHSAGSVVVEVRDDGKGLDRNAILNKARERGLIDDDADINESSLSDREVYNMIFEPGFSTAQTVTDISGRGVGMDVVKKNLESLRGQAEIKSDSGQGSIFKMSVPLTLAIIDGMVVRVGSETYVIPTVSIVSSLKPEQKDISTVLKRGEMLKLQGKLIPLLRLAGIYSIRGSDSDNQQQLVVVVEDDDEQTGLIIDELLGRQQVVIKSLGETMRNIPGISGGAIMPNGRVGLILDIGGLVRFANQASRDSGDNPERQKKQTLAA